MKTKTCVNYKITSILKSDRQKARVKGIHSAETVHQLSWGIIYRVLITPNQTNIFF